MTKNRDRPSRPPSLMRSRPTPGRPGLLSDEHFTVDGTQLEAWARKSFRCRDAAPSAPPTVDFHGERRRNDTHQSTTDPEAMLHRKGQGKEAKLGISQRLCDPRDGDRRTRGGGTVAGGQRAAGQHRASSPRRHAPRGAGPPIDGRTTRHAGYHVSQRKRKLVEPRIAASHSSIGSSLSPPRHPCALS